MLEAGSSGIAYSKLLVERNSRSDSSLVTFRLVISWRNELNSDVPVKSGAVIGYSTLYPSYLRERIKIYFKCRLAGAIKPETELMVDRQACSEPPSSKQQTFSENGQV